MICYKFQVISSKVFLALLVKSGYYKNKIENKSTL